MAYYDYYDYLDEEYYWFDQPFQVWDEEYDCYYDCFVDVFVGYCYGEYEARYYERRGYFVVEDTRGYR